jgi:ABC-type transport system substrate-binding protein
MLVSALLASAAMAAGDRVRSLELTADTKAANPNANQAAYLLVDMWKQLGLDIKIKETPYKQKLDTVYFDRSTCEGAACFDMASPRRSTRVTCCSASAGSPFTV